MLTNATSFESSKVNFINIAKRTALNFCSNQIENKVAGTIQRRIHYTNTILLGESAIIPAV